MLGHFRPGNVLWAMYAAAVPMEHEMGRPNGKGHKETNVQDNMVQHLVGGKGNGHPGEYEPITESWRDLRRLAKERNKGNPRTSNPSTPRHGQTGGDARDVQQPKHTKVHWNPNEKKNRGSMGIPKSSRKEIQGRAPQAEEEHRQHPGEHGESGKSGGKGKALRACIEKAKDSVWLERAKNLFRGKFYAKATAASKNSKRNKIVEIVGRGPPFEIEDFATLGAVLDAANMKAGEQYLQEAKLMHVEDGWNWDLRLENHLTSCKRAVKRDKGPEQRALEVKITDVKENKINEKNKEKVGPQRPGWSYSWAVVWMLRAIEAAAVLTEHVQVDPERKTVKPLIPKSKMDQKGLGVYRTLQCCGGRTCTATCPWDLWNKVKQEASWEKGGKLFPGVNGQDYTKLQMVTSWVKGINKDMAGHSARRTGAMMYARQKMSLPEISFLGRWRSSAVLRYVEEALTEIPANENAIHWEEQQKAKRSKRSKTANPKTMEPKTRQEDQNGPEEKFLEVINLEEEASEKPQPVQPKKPEMKTMWAISEYRGRKISHEVGQCGWGIALEEWTTLCGWHFAKRNVRVQITTKENARKHPQCLKCKKGRKMRDGVNRAREWAHEIGEAVETKQWSQQADRWMQQTYQRFKKTFELEGGREGMLHENKKWIVWEAFQCWQTKKRIVWMFPGGREGQCQFWLKLVSPTHPQPVVSYEPVNGRMKLAKLWKPNNDHSKPTVGCNKPTSASKRPLSLRVAGRACFMKTRSELFSAAWESNPFSVGTGDKYTGASLGVSTGGQRSLAQNWQKQRHQVTPGNLDWWARGRHATAPEGFC